MDGRVLPVPPPDSATLGMRGPGPLRDIYDYVFIENSNPGAYMLLNADTTIFLNETALLANTTLANGSSLASGNGTRSSEEVSNVIFMAATSIILGLMILITVIGNVFVIAAIILERNLQNVANYLVASLAVADLFVACLVMPLGAVYEISQGWILGPELCDIWTSCDVLCCTASILHLVAIATDRYWAVTNVDYMHSRTSKRVFTMIFLVWFAAVIVSLAPQFGWKDPEYLQRIEQQKCMVSQDVAYQVFATCCTFYVPLLVILVLYWKIYQTARKRIHRRRPRPPMAGNNNQTAEAKTKSRMPFRLARFTTQGRSTLGLVEGNSTNTVNTVEDTEYSSNEKKGIEVTSFNNSDEVPGASSANQITTVSHFIVNQGENGQSHQVKVTTAPAETPSAPIPTTATITPSSVASQLSTPTLHPHNQPPSQVSTPIQHSASASTMNPHAQVSKRKETLEAKRERKAAKTLAIITGAFVACWLPFFATALLLPLCDACHINDTVWSLFLWLGYFNSTLNPVIYTIFSPEFRQAFKRILFGAHRNSYYRPGKF
ncbi:5-hydroxytryptamine receptor-like [Lutzomyia longipalpis]|nr:5-hydroxytryptamine receptor-like [Lutzomyia longipalpis]XP_055689658.1 5-hydroxytryptamine receptor-like [Lutzomyia longipalpis]